jgi:hypothetical protein
MGLRDYFLKDKSTSNDQTPTNPVEMAEPTKMINPYPQTNPQPSSDLPSSIPSMSATPRALSTNSSRHNSVFYGNGGESRASTADFINDMKCEVIVNQLHQKQQEKLWSLGVDPGEGVVLKKSRGLYTCAPTSLTADGSGFFEAIQALNVKVMIIICFPSYVTKSH